jgi:CBS domain-containing protein
VIGVVSRSTWLRPRRSASTRPSAKSFGSLRGDLPTAVLGSGDVLLGVVQPTALSLPAITPVERVMITAPGTIRPDLRVDDALRHLHDDGLDHVYVTTVSGVLVGLVTPADLPV